MITNIQWNNDHILGDLNLSFTKDDGSPYRTIVLAGENGTGKTRILQTIATFLNLGTISPFKSITYDVRGVKYTITPNDVNAGIGFHKRTKNGEDVSTLVSGHKSDIKKLKKIFWIFVIMGVPIRKLVLALIPPLLNQQQQNN